MIPRAGCCSDAEHFTVSQMARVGVVLVPVDYTPWVSMSAEKGSHVGPGLLPVCRLGEKRASVMQEGKPSMAETKEESVTGDVVHQMAVCGGRIGKNC